MLGADRELPLQIFSDDAWIFIVIGWPYQQTLSIELLQKYFHNTLLPQGHYVLFRFCKTTAKIEYRMDKYSTYPCFRLLLNGQEHFASFALSLLKLGGAAISADQDAVREFLEQGYTAPGKTLFQGITKLRSENGARESIATHQAEPSLDARLAALDEAFEQALRDIIEYRHVREFRLSGGLDTRVIAVKLWQMGFVPEVVTTVQNPQLADGEDMDVEIARMLCARLGWSHQVLQPEAGKYHFFFGADFKGVLSGLYGGEFLGAQCLAECPTPQAPTRAGFRQAIDIFLNAFRATIYNNSWDAPWTMHGPGVSPYSDARVLDLLLELDTSDLLNYNFFNLYYRKYCADFLDIPLCSMLSLWYPDLPKLESRWKNPKQVFAAANRKLAEPAASSQLYSLAESLIRNDSNQEVPAMQNLALLAAHLRGEGVQI